MPALDQSELEQIYQSVAGFSQDALRYAIEQAGDADKGEQLVQRLQQEMAAEGSSEMPFATVALIVVLGEAKVEGAIPALLSLAMDPGRADTPTQEAATYALQRMGRVALLAAMSQIENSANADSRVLGYEILHAAVDADDATRVAVGDFCLSRLRIECGQEFRGDEWSPQDAVLQAMLVLKEKRAIPVVRELLEKAESDWDAGMYEDWLADLEEGEPEDYEANWRVDWPAQCEKWAAEIEATVEANAHHEQIEQLKQANAGVVEQFEKWLLQSQVPKERAEETADVLGQWLDFAVEHELDLADLEPETFRKVLMQETPAQFCATAEYFQALPVVLDVFLDFLHGARVVEDRKAFDGIIKDAQRRLAKLADDRKLWSYAKLFYMTGLEAGYDMESNEGAAEYLVNLSESLEDMGDKGNESAISEVGRDDPCPCGSGKKYGRCCGK